MSWADTLKATALATLAGRTEAAARASVSTPWSWNAHDVWLRRARNSREVTAQPPRTEPSTSARPSAALHDRTLRS